MASVTGRRETGDNPAAVTASCSSRSSCLISPQSQAIDLFSCLSVCLCHCMFISWKCLFLWLCMCHQSTRALDRRGHGLSQHIQYLKNNMIDENDFFLWNFDTINRTNTLASCLLRSRASCASRSRKFLKKKCVSIDSKCSETHRNAKKKLPFWPITRFARSAKPERRSAMKF